MTMAFATTAGAVRDCSSSSSARAYCLLPAGWGGKSDDCGCCQVLQQQLQSPDVLPARSGSVLLSIPVLLAAYRVRVQG